ncbi:MAG: GTPase-activating protein [Watsoniomyces obsoletus]|nr:MAG: GTPase-activating protein [Watsoniomyces obsoletus]
MPLNPEAKAFTPSNPRSAAPNPLQMVLNPRALVFNPRALALRPNPVSVRRFSPLQAVFAAAWLVSVAIHGRTPLLEPFRLCWCMASAILQRLLYGIWVRNPTVRWMYIFRTPCPRLDPPTNFRLLSHWRAEVLSWTFCAWDAVTAFSGPTDRVVSLTLSSDSDRTQSQDNTAGQSSDTDPTQSLDTQQDGPLASGPARFGRVGQLAIEYPAPWPSSSEILLANGGASNGVEFNGVDSSGQGNPSATGIQPSPVDIEFPVLVNGSSLVIRLPPVSEATAHHIPVRQTRRQPISGGPGAWRSIIDRVTGAQLRQNLTFATVYQPRLPRRSVIREISADNRSLVLALPTIWCKRPGAGNRRLADWPDHDDFEWEGDHRVENYSPPRPRRLPLPSISGQSLGSDPVLVEVSALDQVQRDVDFKIEELDDDSKEDSEPKEDDDKENIGPKEEKSEAVEEDIEIDMDSGKQLIGDGLMDAMDKAGDFDIKEDNNPKVDDDPKEDDDLKENIDPKEEKSEPVEMEIEIDMHFENRLIGAELTDDTDNTGNFDPKQDNDLKEEKSEPVEMEIEIDMHFENRLIGAELTDDTDNTGIFDPKEDVDLKQDADPKQDVDPKEKKLEPVEDDFDIDMDSGKLLIGDGLMYAMDKAGNFDPTEDNDPKEDDDLKEDNDPKEDDDLNENNNPEEDDDVKENNDPKEDVDPKEEKSEPADEDIEIDMDLEQQLIGDELMDAVDKAGDFDYSSPAWLELQRQVGLNKRR